MAKLTILSSLIVTLSMIIPATATAQSAESVPEPVIPAQVDRRNVHIPKISASDIEVGAYTGILSVQDFGAVITLRRISLSRECMDVRRYRIRRSVGWESPSSTRRKSTLRIITSRSVVTCFQARFSWERIGR